MKRGEIYWADFPEPIGRRPALVLTPTAALGYLSSVTVARITTRIRGTRAEVPLGTREGLVRPSAANLYNVWTLTRDELDPEPVGSLHPARTRELDAALSFALGIKRL